MICIKNTTTENREIMPIPIFYKEWIDHYKKLLTEEISEYKIKPEYTFK